MIFSGPVPGQHSVWILKVLITGHVITMDHYIPDLNILLNENKICQKEYLAMSGSFDHYSIRLVHLQETEIPLL
jgi:hypothetical protein